jgi:2-isopropylmalate synthase
VITPARPDLIKKSVASLAGAKHAIIHLYNAVSPVFREVVFRNTKEQTIELTLNAVRLVRSLTEEETARSGSYSLILVDILLTETFAISCRNQIHPQLLFRDFFPDRTRICG